MAKWTLTDAAAKRILNAFVEKMKESDWHMWDAFANLEAVVDAEGLRSYDALNSVIRYIGEHKPNLLTMLSCNLCDKYTSLRKKSSAFLNSFENLSAELDYKHTHKHDEEF